MRFGNHGKGVLHPDTQSGRGYVNDMDSFIPIFLYTISVAALGILVFLIHRLVAPHIGWRHEFGSMVSSSLMEIPKSGNYDVSISRERFWLFKGGGPQVAGVNLAHELPQADFVVTRIKTDELIPYKAKSVVLPNKSGTNKGDSKISIAVGRFRVAAPGEYHISSLSTANMLESDVIQVRKHTQSVDSFSCVIGIVLSGAVFAMGCIFATLMLLR